MHMYTLGSERVQLSVLYLAVTIYVDHAANYTWVQRVYRATTWPAKILEHHQNRTQPRTIQDNSSRSQPNLYIRTTNRKFSL